MKLSIPPTVCGGRALGCLLTLSLAACSGSLESNDPNPGDGSSVPGATAGTGGIQPGGGPDVTGDPPVTDGALDVGRVGIHRLNKAEYDNTMRDLLGVTDTPASTFINDEVTDGFDNIAAAFGMTEAQYQQYYNAADTLAERVFGDNALQARVMTCTPSGATDTACLGQIIGTFGARAWRRPLTDTEIARLVQLASDAMALGEDGFGAIKQVLKTMLSSVPFLYRLELDPDPASLTPRPLNGYELASRLSYLGWSTMPDDAMFALAQSGEILQEATLSAEIDRVLASPKADQFVNNFAGQWLGLRALEQTHQVETTVFPDWNEDLRTAMVQEGLEYFKQFLFGTHQMTEFFTADMNFVSGPLAQLYGVQGGNGTTPTMVNNTTDQRVGFMGLASFLTFTSFSYRTAPTLRGKWVLENLLCQDIPAPPANVQPLDDPGTPSADLQSENVRIRLEAHRADPLCNGCHTLLDPIGMGLENYDAIGRYRTQYDNGDQVDPSGQLPDGSQFSSLPELATLLSADNKLTDCVSERMMTYALSRHLEATDEPYLNQIRQNWAAGGFGLKGLLKQIVLNDTFRFRRGETGVAQ